MFRDAQEPDWRGRGGVLTGQSLRRRKGVVDQAVKGAALRPLSDIDSSLHMSPVTDMQAEVGPRNHYRPSGGMLHEGIRFTWRG